jgi:general secretion pathway protein K
MMYSGNRTLIGRQRGIALITVMWMIAFLTVMAGGVAVVARSDIQLARNVVGMAQARNEAEGGVYYALTRLADASQTKWIGNGSTYRVPGPGMKVEVTIQDEAGRIDINAAEADLLRSLFMAGGADVELADECADAVMDWRDDDQLRRSHGAEWDNYEEAGLSYAPRNGKFLSIDELQMVLPVTKEIFRTIRPALTIYSGGIGVNPALAPAIAMMAISNSDSEAVAQYMTNREESPGRMVTAGMPQVDRRFVEAVGGQVFEISASATTESGLSASVTAVVSLQSIDPLKPFTILNWGQRHLSNEIPEQTAL